MACRVLAFEKWKLKMDAKEFFKTVKRMREAQKTYFRTRRPVDLQRSKEIERTVDAEIARVEQLEMERRMPQLPLFS